MIHWDLSVDLVQMNLHEQIFVCWPSAGPKDIEHTYVLHETGLLLPFYVF